MSKRVTRGKTCHILVIPSDSQRGINYPPSAEADGPPFFQERSRLIGLPVLVHKLAVELNGKSQDGIPVFALYIKNAKALQMESMQNVSRSGRLYPNMIRNT